MSTVIPFDLHNQNRCEPPCVLAKSNQLLSTCIIICLFKRWLFLIKPEDLFDLSGFGSAKAKHAVNIMVISNLVLVPVFPVLVD
jgi:hypothetical protein